MLRFIFGVVVFLFISGNSYAEQNKDRWNELLLNSVRFAENGNDIIVDIEQMKIALKNGANANWIGPFLGLSEERRSILSSYVDLCSSEFRTITKYRTNEIKTFRGEEAISLLFENGAKIQSVDSEILFWPIARGWYSVTKLLLEKGVSAKSWPASIGTKLTPIEYAAKEGYNT